MSGSNPFDTGTATEVDSAQAAAIRKKFEQQGALFLGVGQEELPTFDETDPDAQLRLLIDPDHMRVRAVAKAPEDGGKPLDKELLATALKEARVVFGLDQKNILRLLLPTYDEVICIAVGQRPKSGADGRCEELLPRQPQPAQAGEGQVDYEAAGLYRDLKAGTLVCSLTQPTEGENGTNVLGESLPGTKGAMPPVPAGEGLQILPDGKRVVMIQPGNLVFREGAFCVEQELCLDELPKGPGRIRFSGDVVARFCLPDGCEVQAGGQVRLAAGAGAVQVRARGDIELAGEVEGKGEALFEAKGDIRAFHVKEATLRAKGSITADQLEECSTEADGDVTIIGEEAFLSGGRLTAFGNVKVTQVGMGYGVLTTVTLGVTGFQKELRERYQERLGDLQQHINALQKDITTAQRLVKDRRPVPPDKAQANKRAELQLPICQRKKEQIEQTIEEYEQSLLAVSGSVLWAGRILPHCKISIGGRSTNVIEARPATRAALDKDGDLELTETEAQGS